jgi:hypothetical protein
MCSEISVSFAVGPKFLIRCRVASTPALSSERLASWQAMPAWEATAWRYA